MASLLVRYFLSTPLAMPSFPRNVLKMSARFCSPMHALHSGSKSKVSAMFVFPSRDLGKWYRTWLNVIGMPICRIFSMRCFQQCFMSLIWLFCLVVLVGITCLLFRLERSFAGFFGMRLIVYGR